MHGTITRELTHRLLALTWSEQMTAETLVPLRKIPLAALALPVTGLPVGRFG